MQKVNIKTFLENPIENSDNCSNFYDWFCNKDSLENKMLKLVPKLKFFVKEGLVDIDENYVWFKNNCPMEGNLYDDVRFSSLAADGIINGGFCPKTGHKNKDNKFSVWGWIDGEFCEIELPSWSDFKNKIKTDPEFKLKIVKLLA